LSQAAAATQAKAHWPGRGELRPRTHYEVGHSARSEPPDLDELLKTETHPHLTGGRRVDLW